MTHAREIAMALGGQHTMRPTDGLIFGVISGAIPRPAKSPKLAGDA
jgi:hypothetical protein